MSSAHKSILKIRVTCELTFRRYRFSSTFLSIPACTFRVLFSFSVSFLFAEFSSSRMSLQVIYCRLTDFGSAPNPLAILVPNASIYFLFFYLTFPLFLSRSSFSSSFYVSIFTLFPFLLQVGVFDHYYHSSFLPSFLMHSFCRFMVYLWQILSRFLCVCIFSSRASILS